MKRKLIEWLKSWFDFFDPYRHGDSQPFDKAKPLYTDGDNT